MSNLIFSISPGRSGSKYLYKLLDTAENVTAFHEPKPSMAGRYLKLYPSSNPDFIDYFMYIPIYIRKYFLKVRAIKGLIKILPENHFYAETNHLFILSFYDVILNHFENPHVIILRRYLPKVLKSWVELGHFTENCKFTPYWAVPPNSKSAAVKALGDQYEMDQVDNCIAYLIDIEGRTQRFIEQYKDKAHIVEVRLEDLNKYDRVIDLFNKLNIIPTDKTKELVGRVINVREKQKLGQSISEEECLERIHLYVEKCKEKGIILPHLPNLEKQLI